MSADDGEDGEDGDGGPGRREVAYRLFAAEFDDANLEYSESDEERAPNYVVTPTGARVNRLFAVGVLTEVESVSDDVLRGRIVDPTGAFVLYAGQYQQDERAFLNRADPPTFVAVTGKARTFQPDDSDRVFTSVRPESLSEVDADTRDRWTVDAAEQTIDRVRAMATAIALDAGGDRLEQALVDRGVEKGLADGIVQALPHYGTTPTYLAAVRNLATNAARHVAGELDEVPALDASPDDPGDVQATDLLDEPVEPLADDGEPADATASTETAATEPVDASESAEPAGSAEPSESGTPADTQESTVAAETDPDPETATATTSTSSVDDAAGGVDGATETTEPTETTESPETAVGETVEDDTSGTDDGETGVADEADEPADGPGDFEPDEFDLDEDEREEIEEEYGTEFQSGTEVDEPGEADIETPDPEAVADDDAESVDTATTAAEASAGASEPDAPSPETTDTAETATTAPEPGGSSESEDGDPSDAADGESDDVDLVDAVVTVMDDLDDGDGADRDAVVTAVADRHGADPEDVEDAIQDALMDGRCYEPDDGVLKPI